MNVCERMSMLFTLVLLSCNGKPEIKPTPNKGRIAVEQKDTIQIIDQPTTTCAQINCMIWIKVNITQQRLYLYVDGNLTNTFVVTTGDAKHKTPTMDRRPSGPMYEKYTSKKFPGGDYMGLGNMPYVMFIKGGYAIHGTTKGNILLLGKKISHGCIRLHPDNAKIVYELIQAKGLENVWVTIEK